VAFQFDKSQALKPVKVAWKLNPQTVARLDEIARREGVQTEQVAQQMLEHVLRHARRQGTEAEPAGEE
jgi:hypothetical protein